MFGWLSEASTCASRSKRRADPDRAANASGSTFIATSRLQLRVARPIHLAHPAGAQRAGDVVDADAACQV